MVFLANIYWSSIILILLALILSTTCSGFVNKRIENKKASNNSHRAIFVFGDSTVDPGNNNYVKTIFKGDFPPYGVDYDNHIPTGRFSNGRLATDFIASYAGIKRNIPPYLNSTLSLDDLITGVSFASAGSGYDPLSNIRADVIDMPTQLKYFDEYIKTVGNRIGKKRMKMLMKHSVFLVSCGTNDIIYTYGIVETPIESYTVPTYLHFLLEQCKWFMQALMDRGAINIAIVGLPPIGCLPAIITVHNLIVKPRMCVESLSAMARDYNQMLESELKTLQASQPNSLFVYADIYTPIEDQVNHPEKYGFDEVSIGCCGTGVLEVAFLCSSKSVICNDRSKYLFWDSIHPTETSYYFVAEALRPTVDFVFSKI